MHYQLRVKRVSQYENETGILPWINKKSPDQESLSLNSPSSVVESKYCLLLKVAQAFLFVLCLYAVVTVFNRPPSGHSQQPLLPPLHTVDRSSLVTPYPTTLLDIKNFSLLTQPWLQPCARKDLLFVIVVHSGPDHFAQRQAIRDTWGGVRNLKSASLEKSPSPLGVGLVFVLGQYLPDDGKDGDVKARIMSESQSHGDLLIGSFADKYHNLRYKHVLGLGWVATHCMHANYVLKADDDAFVDLPGLQHFLNRNLGPFQRPEKDLLAGNVLPPGTKPQREGKWAVSVEEYPWGAYPKYLGGLAYVASPHTVTDLWKVAHTSVVPQVWVDDVWVTGLLGGALGIRPILLNTRYSYDHQEMALWLLQAPPYSPPIFTFAHLDPQQADWLKTVHGLWRHALVAYNMSQENHNSYRNPKTNLHNKKITNLSHKR